MHSEVHFPHVRSGINDSVSTDVEASYSSEPVERKDVGSGNTATDIVAV